MMPNVPKREKRGLTLGTLNLKSLFKDPAFWRLRKKGSVPGNWASTTAGGAKGGGESATTFDEGKSCRDAKLAWLNIKKKPVGEVGEWSKSKRDVQGW